MRTVAIAQFKARLSEFLDQVRAGVEYLITDRGKPVARLLPLKSDPEWSIVYQDLVKKGLIRPPKKKLPAGFFNDVSKIKDPQGRLLQTLLEEREQGR